LKANYAADRRKKYPVALAAAGVGIAANHINQNGKISD